MLGGARQSVKDRVRNATGPQSNRHRRAADAGHGATYARDMDLSEPIAVERDFTTFSVRDGRLAPVTCVACGCRLERRAEGSWWHFSGRGDRDARGCIVACAERPHYAGGIVAVAG
jgi:hypothetical protein